MLSPPSLPTRDCFVSADAHSALIYATPTDFCHVPHCTTCSHAPDPVLAHRLCRSQHPHTTRQLTMAEPIQVLERSDRSTRPDHTPAARCSTPPSTDPTPRDACKPANHPQRPSQPRDILRFIGVTVKETVSQTRHVFWTNSKCTWLLLRQLPKPYIDSVRLLTRLWCTVLGAFALVFLAICQRLLCEIERKVRRCLANLLRRWIGRHAPPASPPRASPSSDVQPSVVPWAPSSTTPSPSRPRQRTRNVSSAQERQCPSGMA